MRLLKPLLMETPPAAQGVALRRYASLLLLTFPSLTAISSLLDSKNHANNVVNTVGKDVAIYSSSSVG